MLLTLLQAKLHRVAVTHADLHYDGSCAIDETLLEASGIRPYQHIDVYNVSTGGRFATYALRAERDSGQIGLNGAAARLAVLGDLLIICAYAQYTEAEAAAHQPVVIRVDGRNRPLPDGR